MRRFLFALSLFTVPVITAPARAACFDKQSVPAQLTSAEEKTFKFDTLLIPCDSNSDSSAFIDSAVVLIVKAQRTILKGGVPENKTEVYFEFNYNFYNGSSSWGGWQPIFLTVQDSNHNDLLPHPIFADGTPRNTCYYGHSIPVKSSGPLQGIFDQIAYVTLTIPRVGRVNGGC